MSNSIQLEAETTKPLINLDIRPADTATPYVSVVIPTYNRLQNLKRVLAGLQHQNYPLDQFEIIVVSDGSSDGTNAYLETLQTPLHLVSIIQVNQGPAATRNHGWQRAAGEFILFVDDDVVPTPTLIVEHMQTHAAHTDDIVVLGPMLTPDDFEMLPWVRWEQAMLLKQYNDMTAGCWQPTARQFYSGNTSLARRFLEQSGGFDSTFRRAEDVELAYRLAQQGLRFVFNPNAIGYHYAERGFRSWLDIPYAYGRNDIIFVRDKQQDWLLPAVCQEFHERHILIRQLIHLCLSRPILTHAVQPTLKRLADLAHLSGLSWLVQMAYSGLFNLRYYQGMADELGGREPFFRAVRHLALS